MYVPTWKTTQKAKTFVKYKMYVMFLICKFILKIASELFNKTNRLKSCVQLDTYYRFKSI